MNYNQGDRVVHQNFGVGTVVTIETKNTGDESSLFYRVSFDKTTVWVPVRDHPRAGVRPITPKSDLSRYRALLKTSAEPLNDDFRKRQIELENRRDSGTYKGLCEVVRDLSDRLTKKSLTQYEKTLLKQTRDLLISEWSVTSEVSSEEASREIDGCLRMGRELSASV